MNAVVSTAAAFVHSTALPLKPGRFAGWQFKIADCEEEFEAVHRLNHRTFAEEIPQHEPNAGGRLVDRFHERNRYVIALKKQDHSLAGMVCLRLERPFSLDQKIPEAMATLPAGRSWCEIRLLALEARHRGTPLLAGLLRALIQEAEAQGCDAAVISATTRQWRLYRHLGFTSFGPQVGREGAWYQPMWILLETLQRAVPALMGGLGPGRRKLMLSPQTVAAERWETSSLRSSGEVRESGRRRKAATMVNFTPGPVEVPEGVRTAFQRPAIPHRGPEALRMLEESRRALCVLTGARHAALLSGGGTLANDVVAAQLGLMAGTGLIVDSGEFGGRLTDHARRAGLRFETMSLSRGASLTVEGIRSFLQGREKPAWFWLAHCETSTGALQPLGEIADFCRETGIALCADCVSSLGCVPVDLSRVHLATASSGKALAAMPGIAIVFHRDSVEPAKGGIPRCLDLGMHAGPAGGGMPFTLSSPLLAALHAALTLTHWPAKLERVRKMGTALRREMEAAGLPLLAVKSEVSPAVITLRLPPQVPCVEFARGLEREGIRLAAHRGYLLEKNEVQVCLMGDLRAERICGLAQRLARALRSFPAGGEKGRPG